MRTFVVWWLAMLALILVPAAAAARKQDPESGRSWSRFREAGEDATLAPAETEAVYRLALRFYRPPRNQCRWLMPDLLPAFRAGGDSDRLEPALAARLVAGMGARFCAGHTATCCREEHGVELFLSRVYARSTDSVRVVVASRLQWPGATMNNGAQSFLIVRDPDGWRIADRGGAE